MSLDFSSSSWRKSSYSGEDEGSECVQVAAWRKSSHSGGSEGSTCVEVAELEAAVGVRDSKDPDGPKLVLSPTDWKLLITGIKNL